MDVLQGLPVWIQLVVAFLVAAVLIFMNIGWLIQARAWLERRGRQLPGMTGQLPTGASGTRETERRARPDGDRA